MYSKKIDPKIFFKLVIGGDFEKLKSQGFTPRRGMPSIPIELPMNWKSSDSNIAFNLHAWRFMRAVWAYYVKQPSDETAKLVFDYNIKLIRDWVDFSENNKSKYAWYDMSVGIRSMHLAFMKHIAINHKSKMQLSDVSFIDFLSQKHILWLSKENNIVNGNHAVYQILGLRLLTIIYDENKFDEYIERNIKKLVGSAFDCNWVNTENSPFYHKYNFDLYSSFSPNIFPSLKDYLNKLISNAPNITKWLTSPDGDLYRIGDTEGKGKLLTADDVAKDGFSISDKVVFKDLGESGYQVVRSHPNVSQPGSFSLVFRCGRQSDAHAHCDELSFIYYNAGVEIFSDPGKYTYQSNSWREHFVGDAAHNTVGHVGINLLPKSMSGKKVKLAKLKCSIKNEEFHFSGEVDKSSLLVKRDIKFRPEEGLIVFDKVLENKDKERFVESRFQFSHEIDLVYEINNKLLVFRANDCVAEISFDPKPKFCDIVYGNEYKGWVSESYMSKKKAFFCRAILSDDRLETIVKHKTVRFKKNFLGQSTSIPVKGYSEYKYKNVRYISRTLPGVALSVICFSSFPAKDEKQKYKFINTIAQLPLNFIFLFDQNEPDGKDTGAYYLDKEGGDSYLESVNEIVDNAIGEMGKDNVILIGSSKGASSAMLYGFKYGYNRLLIESPQVRIGSYIKKNAPHILSFFNGLSVCNLDDVVLNSYKYGACEDLNMKIVCGVNDEWHLRELEKLRETINFSTVFVEDSHSKGALDRYDEILYRYLNASSKKKEFLSLESIEVGKGIYSSYIVCKDKIFVNFFCSDFLGIPKHRRVWACYFHLSDGSVMKKKYTFKDSINVLAPNSLKFTKYTVFLKDSLTGAKHISGFKVV